MEFFYRAENEAMPYVTGNTLTVNEFRGASESPTLWTTRGAMESWSRQRRLWGGPIPVGYAFRRPYEGGHSNQSQHYAGTCFDVGQNMFGWTNRQRAALRASARNSGLWVYVEPVIISPTWVHFDRRQRPPACSTGGYPTLRSGSRSVYVLILQDCLNTVGKFAGELDGVFGPLARSAVMGFQRSAGLAEDGVVGCDTWRSLTGAVVGRGRTGSTID